MMNATGMTKEEENELWRELRRITNEEADAYADSLGINRPKLKTTIKPEGTLSTLPTVSSGVHYSHSPYYVRRVRITSKDPLVKVCEELGYPIFPDNGEDVNNPQTVVIEFPIKAPEGKTKFDVGAIEQLENYKRTMEHYTDHNTSITVHVRDDEWEAVEDWMYENWEDVVGISFLPLSDAHYNLMPYEAITEEEYNRRTADAKPFNPSLLQKYEVQSHEDDEDDVTDAECASGVCPVR